MFFGKPKKLSPFLKSYDALNFKERILLCGNGKIFAVLIFEINPILLEAAEFQNLCRLQTWNLNLDLLSSNCKRTASYFYKVLKVCFPFISDKMIVIFKIS